MLCLPVEARVNINNWETYLMKNVERRMLASGLFFFMVTSNCECFILVGKMEMTTRPQLCLHFSQLLSQVSVKLIFFFLSLSSVPEVSNGSLHLEICQFLSILWRAKQKKKKTTTRKKSPLTHNTPSCSTSNKFCNTSVLPKCPAVACFPFDKFSWIPVPLACFR